MNYSAAHFQDYLQTAFRIELLDGQSLALCLDQISVRDNAAFHQFSLFFLCEGGLQLQQGTYCLQHDSLAPLSIFLVPIACTGNVYRYQAAFSVALPTAGSES